MPTDAAVRVADGSHGECLQLRHLIVLVCRVVQTLPQGMLQDTKQEAA